MQEPTSFSLALNLDYIAILRGIWRRHKLLVAGAFVGIALPLVGAVYYMASPTYVSTATIAVEPSALAQIPSLRGSPSGDPIASHMVLLKSRSLAEAVIDAVPKDALAEILAKPQHLGYYWLLLNDKVKGWLGWPPTPLSPRELAITELQKARMEFVQSPVARNVFIISATATRPRVAMDLVNTHIQVLLNRSRSFDNEEARKAWELLEGHYQQVKDNVTRGENALAKRQQQKGRIRSSVQTERELARLDELENSLTETQVSRQILASRIEALRRSLDQKPRAEISRQHDNPAKNGSSGVVASTAAENLEQQAALNTAKDKLTKLQNKLDALRERYTDAHPLVQSTQEEVTRQRAHVTQLARQLPASPATPATSPSTDFVLDPATLALLERADTEDQLSALEKESNALGAKEETLKALIGRMRAAVRSLNPDEEQYGDLRRSLEQNRNLLAVVSERLMAARIREHGESSVIRIVDPASFPLLPNGSKRQNLLLLVLAMAGSMAVGLAFAVEFWHQPVDTEADVERATGLPILGSVGKMESSASSKHTRGAKPILLPGYPVGATVTSNRPIHVELYRAMCANIETERRKATFRSIMVTSPVAHEGKSTTILNLAHAFQELGRRVLVVEADLRRPSLASPLALTNNPGVVDYLRGAATFEQACRYLPSGVAIVPGQVARGASMPLLASPRLKELLDEAGSRFELILIDSAPVLAVPDNLLLTHAVDHVILVARAGLTTVRDLRKAQAAVVQTGGRIIGVVLNEATARDVGYYHPRYRKYYAQHDPQPHAQGARETSASAASGSENVGAGSTAGEVAREKAL